MMNKDTCIPHIYQLSFIYFRPMSAMNLVFRGGDPRASECYILDHLVEQEDIIVDLPTEDYQHLEQHCYVKSPRFTFHSAPSYYVVFKRYPFSVMVREYGPQGRPTYVELLENAELNVRIITLVRDQLVRVEYVIPARYTRLFNVLNV